MRVPAASAPMVYAFRAGGRDYVLDLHTNRLFSLDVREAEVLRLWLSGTPLHDLSRDYPGEVVEIIRMQEQGLFCTVRPRGLAFGADWNRINDEILHHRQRTVIELTEHCNLRCKYCTFGGGFSDHRIHGSQFMRKDVLIHAIDEAFVYGDRCKEISIGFYGGEPLIGWDLLQTAVREAQSCATRQNVRFSVTTNATLLDKSKAEFLRDAGFSVLVSLDGPRELHDHYRIYRNGRGTYSKVVEGLKLLLQTYPEADHKKIGLSMVVPSYRWLNRLEKLWDDEPWLPRSLRAQAVIVNPPAGFVGIEPPVDDVEASFKAGWISSVLNGEQQSTTLGRELFDSTLAKFHQRPKFSGCRKAFFPNGCCIPGARKVYVQVDGQYRICERVHGAPTIGSVGKGVDLSAIRELVDDYVRNSFPDCESCFAISSCTQCFLHAYRDGKYDVEKKRIECAKSRRSLQKKTELYALISSQCPETLQKWDSYTIM